MLPRLWYRAQANSSSMSLCTAVRNAAAWDIAAFMAFTIADRSDIGPLPS
jgi:hypothetical protein